MMINNWGLNKMKLHSLIPQKIYVAYRLHGMISHQDHIAIEQAPITTYNQEYFRTMKSATALVTKTFGLKEQLERGHLK